VVGLGLAGVADDEARAEGRPWLAGTDGVDALEVAVAGAPAPHAAHEGRRHVLERQVEVRDAGVADGVDQRVVEVRRVEVQEPDALHPLGHGGHEGDQRPLADPLVAPVAGQVLGDEDDLADAALRERLDLGQHAVERSGPLGTPEARDGAEPAGLVAPLRHLHVGPRRAGRGPRQLEQVEGRDGRAGGAGGRLAAERDRHPEARHGIRLGQRVGQLLAVALGQAARDHEAGAPGLAPGQVQDDLDGLLPGLLDERAGVHDDEVGRRGVVDGRHPVGQQGPDELVRVDLVLRAAQGLDEERAVPRHGAQGYPWPPRGPACAPAPPRRLLSNAGAQIGGPARQAQGRRSRR
jgi:hypothetical protein